MNPNTLHYQEWIYFKINDVEKDKRNYKISHLKWRMTTHKLMMEGSMDPSTDWWFQWAIRDLISSENFWKHYATPFIGFLPMFIVYKRCRRLENIGIDLLILSF